MADELDDDGPDEIELTPEEQAAAELQTGEAEESEEAPEGEAAEDAELDAEIEKLSSLAEEHPEVQKILDELIELKEERAARTEAEEKAKAEKKTDAPAVSEEDASADDQFAFEQEVAAAKSQYERLSAQHQTYCDAYEVFRNKISSRLNTLVESQMYATAKEALENDELIQDWARQAKPFELAANQLLRKDESGNSVGPLAEATGIQKSVEMFREIIARIPEAQKFPRLYAEKIQKGEINPKDIPSIQRKVMRAALAEKLGGKKPGPPVRKITNESVAKLMKLRGVGGKKTGRQPVENGASVVKDRSGKPVVRSKDPVVNKALDYRNLM